VAVGVIFRIVAMTAHAMTGDAERCFAAGMDAYLSKPVDRVKLFEVIANIANGMSRCATDRPAVQRY
jgi:CheY-like chemotaxis protein